jgi:hypothetical protein
MRNSYRVGRVALGVAGMSFLMIASGCSASPGKDSGTTAAPKVASLVTSPASVPAKAADADANRPRERLDMTDAEKREIAKPYQDCLVKHGMESDAEILKMRSEHRVSKIPEAARKAAEAGCQELFPLPPWEEDANNPEAADFAHKVVLCLKGKGVSTEVSDDTSDGTVSVSFVGGPLDSDAVQKGMTLLPVCQKEVAAAK